MIIVALVLGLIVLFISVLSISGNAKRTRESQERLEKHAISQLPLPADFGDCSAEVVQKVREGQKLGAIAQYMKEKGDKDLDGAKRRVEELRQALLNGPALGRPPRGLFES